jgi:5-methylcytosine-specific restriction protein A
MPHAAKRPCLHAGCPVLVGSGYCVAHAPVHTRALDQQRGSRHERGYDSKWVKARAGYLAHHPLCAECERNGMVAAATVVDHIVPHKLDMTLFWDVTNWQPLCKACHDAKTAREDGGFGNRRARSSPGGGGSSL